MSDTYLTRNKQSFLQGGGNAGLLIRSTDWSSTILGDCAVWPSGLRHSISMLLNTNLPMLVCWGADYLQFYNDAFYSFNKDNTSLIIGESVKNTYEDIWNEIGPCFQRAMQGDVTEYSYFNSEARDDESQTDRFFDFLFGPILDDEDLIGGVRVICIEKTQIKIAQAQTQESTLEQPAISEEFAASNEELAATNEELISTNDELNKTQQMLEQTVKGLSESEGRFRNLIREATVGIILLIGSEMKVEIVNEAYALLIGRTAEELENNHLFDIIPEAESYFRPTIDSVRETGIPVFLYDQSFQVYRDGDIISGFLNLTYQPYQGENGIITGVMVLCQDVTDQVKARQLLKETETQFHLILDAIPQQVWTSTPDGALNYVNQVISKDFGHDAESVVGHGWQEFVHPDDLPHALRNWQRALQSGDEYHTEFRLRFADGNYYWHLARALPFREKNTITSWLGTNTNIHLQKTNEYKKDEFISIASHELKTPLTTIKAFFQLVKREIESKSPLNTLLSKSEGQMERLERLIGDLLDVSKINAGKMIYNKDEFDFSKAMRDVIDAIQQTTESHTIEFNAPPEVIIIGDEHRLEQVIINLLNNAIKYSPDADRIMVILQLEGGNIIVSVQDYGIGIAEKHLKELFDRFYRVENTSSRFQGLGLGLFISAEIVKRHSGSFWIESQVGEGSTFFFLLPRTGEQHFIDISTDNKTRYEGNYIQIHYKSVEKYLDVDWIGYQSYDSVVKGCEIILDLMQKNNCNRVLNDNTRVKGNWSEAADWGAKVWFPAMAQAGLKKFSWIYSPSTFSRIASSKSIPPSYDEVQLAFFDDKSQALNWLLEE